MFEENRCKKLYVTTLYMTGKKFAYYEIHKPYLGSVCLTQPAGACLCFLRLNQLLELT